MKKFILHLIIILSISTLFTSCNKDKQCFDTEIAGTWTVRYFSQTVPGQSEFVYDLTNNLGHQYQHWTFPDQVCETNANVYTGLATVDTWSTYSEPTTLESVDNVLVEKIGADWHMTIEERESMLVWVDENNFFIQSFGDIFGTEYRYYFIRGEHNF